MTLSEGVDPMNLSALCVGGRRPVGGDRPAHSRVTSIKLSIRWNRFVYRFWSPIYDGLFDRFFAALGRRRAMTAFGRMKVLAPEFDFLV